LRGADDALRTEAADRRLPEIREANARLRSALLHLNEQTREILAAAVRGELVSQEPTWAADKSGVFDHGLTEPDLFDEQARQWDWLVGFNWTLAAAWKWRRMDEVGTSILGRQRSPQHERGSHMRSYLRVANVLEDQIDFSDLKRMNFSPKEADIYRLQGGDVLLNEGQSPELVGRPALYKGEIKELYFQNHLIRFRASRHIVPEFALLVFRHYMHSGVFRQISRWSTNIANMGLTRFRSLPFPVPPREEQELIVTEARRRLDATTAQLLAVRTSLNRLPEFEQELLAAAVAGDLVPQNPEDEAASTLLQRLDPPGRDVDATTRPSGRGDRMSNKRSRPTRQAEPTPDLAAVLRQNGGTLPLPELFSQAGYDRDLPEHVELFYLALRDALGRTIRLNGDATENATLEAVDVA
jgi:hypothetical protein